MNWIIVRSIAFTMLLCSTVSCVAKTSAPQEVSEDKQSFSTAVREWLEPTAWLSRRVQKVVASEKAVRVFAAGGEDYTTQIEEFTKAISPLISGNPHQVSVVKVPDSKSISKFIISSNIDDETMELIHERFNPSAMISVINGNECSTVEIAASSILKASRTYMQPSGWVGDLLFIIDYGQGYSIVVTFWQSGDNTVTGEATFILTENAEKLLSGLRVMFGEISSEELSKNIFNGL